MNEQLQNNSTFTIPKSVKSLGADLRDQIELHFESTTRNNALMQGARMGKVTPQILANYVENTLHLISHTPPFLHLAKGKALALGNQALSDFYDIKLKEEDGHDLWAEEDKAALYSKFGVRPSLGINPYMQRLVDSIFALIEEDPVLYLAYIIVAEHLTVLAGPPWIQDLVNHCALSADMVRVIGNHAELDKEHVVEMIEAIDRLAPSGKYRQRFEQIVEESMALHNQFCNSVAQS